MSKKAAIYLLPVLLLFISGSAGAQTVIFRKVIGNTGYDNGMSAVQTLDTGYVVLGSTSSSGAGSSDVFLVKTDSTGLVRGSQTFGGINIDRGTCVRQTADSGFVISGYSNSFGTGGYDVYVIKLNKAFQPVWEKTYGGNNWDFGNCVEQTSDGGFIICGETYSYGQGDEDYYIIKTDMNGDTLWTRTYGGTNQDIAKSIVQTSDGGYIVTGTSKSLGDATGDFWTIKLNSSGDSTWTNRFGGPLADYGNDIIESASGGYLVVGETKSFGAGNSDGILIKIAAGGTTDSTKTLGGAQNDDFRSVTEDAYGKVAIAGMTVTYGDGSGHGDMIFYTLKSDWSYYGLTTFGSAGSDAAYSVEPTMDKAFIICGTTNGFNSGIDDMYLIKTDTLSLAFIAESNFYTEIPETASAKQNSFSVYPNPASDRIYIEPARNEENAMITVTDLLGKKQEEKKFTAAAGIPYELELDGLSKGVYFITVQGKAVSETRKLIIK